MQTPKFYILYISFLLKFNKKENKKFHYLKLTAEEGDSWGLGDRHVEDVIIF